MDYYSSQPILEYTVSGMGDDVTFLKKYPQFSRVGHEVNPPLEYTHFCKQLLATTPTPQMDFYHLLKICFGGSVSIAKSHHCCRYMDFVRKPTK